MAYEEAIYKVVYIGDNFEIRFYDERVIVQTKYKGTNNCFQKLLDISLVRIKT